MDNNPIKRALKHRGRDIKWLASTLNKDYTSLCKRIKDQTFSIKELNAILLHLELRPHILFIDKEGNIL